MGRRKKELSEALAKAVAEGKTIYPPLSKQNEPVRFIGWEPEPKKQYSVKTRYEHWTSSGKTWCNWFELVESYNTKEEAEKHIAECKKYSVNKIMKLKEEYKIVQNF